MSQWRKEALSRLPDLQRVITAAVVDTPMMLWIELNMEFSRRCEDQSDNLDLLRRIWGYGLWCLHQRSDEVSSAAALGFFEHAVDTPARIKLLPEITSRTVLEGFRDLLESNHSGSAVSLALDKGFGAAKTVQELKVEPQRRPKAHRGHANHAF